MLRNNAMNIKTCFDESQQIQIEGIRDIPGSRKSKKIIIIKINKDFIESHQAKVPQLGSIDQLCKLNINKFGTTQINTIKIKLHRPCCFEVMNQL